MMELLSYEHWLVVLSVMIIIAGSYAYIRDTLTGKTMPNRVSWTMWALAPLVATGAAISAEADFWAIIRVFLAGLLPLIVLIASFYNPNGYWKLTRFDMWCGVLSLIAFFVWLGLDLPVYAILIGAIADAIAVLPTAKKAWQYPESETGITYIASFIATVLVIPSIPVWNIENAAFQVYLLIANTVLVSIVYRKRMLYFFQNK